MAATGAHCSWKADRIPDFVIEVAAMRQCRSIEAARNLMNRIMLRQSSVACWLAWNSAAMKLGRLNHVGVATPSIEQVGRAVSRADGGGGGAGAVRPAGAGGAGVLRRHAQQPDRADRAAGRGLADREVPRAQSRGRAASSLLRGAGHRGGAGLLRRQGRAHPRRRRGSGRMGRRSSSSTPRTWAGC